MIEIIGLKRGDQLAESLLVETCTTVVTLLFMPTMGRSQAERLQDDYCMSLDGPQSLALTSFLAAFFSLGPGKLTF